MLMHSYFGASYVFAGVTAVAFIHDASYVCHDSFIGAMTPSDVCHDSFSTPSYVHRRDCCCLYPWRFICVCHDSFTCVPWLIHMCAMTHLYVCHDSFMCVQCVTHRRNSTCIRSTTTHIASYMWHDPYVCVPWLVHMCDMTHSYVCHDSFTGMTDSLTGMKASFMCPVTRSYRDSCIHCVPWLIHTVCPVTHSQVR